MKRQVFIFIACILTSKLYCQLKPFDALPHMMRGINLGNTLELPQEGKWNPTDPPEWSSNGPAQEYYFDAYKEAGFQSVRIPITWHTHTLETAPYTIDATWLKRVEEVVDWALKRDFYVIIDAHHEAWLKNNYTSVENQARFDSVWSQISSYFKDKPSSLLFDILNEPNGMKMAQVNELNARILGIIRKTNPTRIVIFSGNNWANVEELVGVGIPKDDYVMGYYHSYDPWTFAGLGQGTWGTSNDLYALRSRMDKATAWVTKNNIPVVISEFGTDTLCDYNSRMLYLATYVEEASKRNLAFNVWDDGGTFQVYRRKTNAWHDTKEIFTNFSSLCPNKVILSKDANSITITWNNRLVNADSLFIEKRISNTQFENITKLAVDISTYTDKDLTSEEYYYYRIKAYKNDSVYYSYPQRMLIPPSISERKPFYGKPFTVPCNFQAVDFDKGGFGLTYFDLDFVNSTNLYRTDKGIDIDTISKKHYVLINNRSGEWCEYSISVGKTTDYEISTLISSVKGGGYIGYTIDGVSKLAFVKATGDSSVFKANTIITKLTEGEHIIRLNIFNTVDYIIDSIYIKEYVAPTYSKINGWGQLCELQSNVVESALTINPQDTPLSNVDISIYSIDGLKLFDFHQVTIPYTVAVDGLVSGVYAVKIKSGSESQTLRFIKK